MGKNTIRVGLAGCGYWGSKHLRVFNELPDVELTALCEPSLENVGRQPRGFLPPIVTGDYEQFLSSGIDAVVIATPAQTHVGLAMRALERDKHVLVEKPFTTSSADALELITAAERRGLTIAVGHTYMYHPAVEYLRQTVELGRLGALRYIHAARLNFGLLQPDVDALWDLAPHDLSILMYVLQQEPIVLSAHGAAFLNPGLCEVGHLDLDFAGGPSAHVYVSWMEPTKVRRLTFVGEERTVVYDDVAQGEQIRVFDKSIRLVSTNGAQSRRVPQYLDGDITIPLLGQREPLKTECADFLNSIRSGVPPRSDGWTGLRVVRILETAQRLLYQQPTPLTQFRFEGAPAPVFPREPSQ
ncbi:MAG: Gfo/Idh/MocA family oxidoreductase [Dehalococcoidia bacterium]